MGKLAISLGSLPVLAVEIGQENTRLGRSAENDIVLPLPDVADFHAEIHASEDECVVRACAGESLRVQGRSVNQARLAAGEEIGLGGYQLRWIVAGLDSELTAAQLELASARSHGTKPLEPAERARARITGLEVVSGPEKGVRVPLQATASTLGRSPECDFVLKDEAVSWRHCSFELTREGVRIRDLGSRNGTFLDGRRIELALAEANSRVQVGQTMLKLTGPAEVGAGDIHEGLAELIGRSAAMQEVFAQLREACASRVPVVLLGETGTGKELAARALHSVGGRAAGPFVPVNCAAIPRELLEDELFGHARGAFTGAISDRQGAFERADGGTIFLDEIGELPLDLQPKMLRVIEDGEIPRLGGGVIRSDFRVVAATNSDLQSAVGEGRFRQDLFFRLAVFPIRLPPLRERVEDLPELLHHFLATAEEQTGVTRPAALSFDAEALERLRQHSWPGNVRELRNLVLRAVVGAKVSIVDAELVETLLSDLCAPEPMPAATATSLEELEREVIRKALTDSAGQRRAAARRLGIAESTLYEKINRYNLAQVGRQS